MILVVQQAVAIGYVEVKVVASGVGFVSCIGGGEDFAVVDAKCYFFVVGQSVITAVVDVVRVFVWLYAGVVDTKVDVVGLVLFELYVYPTGGCVMIWNDVHASLDG